MIEVIFLARMIWWLIFEGGGIGTVLKFAGCMSAVLVLMTLCSALMLFAPPVYAESIDAIAQDLYGSSPRMTQDWHGLDGFIGRDYSGGCGAVLYSPIDGVIMYNGLDGYNRVEGRKVYPQNTQLVISGSAGRLTLLHGRYFGTPGDMIVAGQPIGKEDSIGWSTGCHSHVVWE